MQVKKLLTQISPSYIKSSSDFEAILQDFEAILQDFDPILRDFPTILQDFEAILQDFFRQYAWVLGILTGFLGNSPEI